MDHGIIAAAEKDDHEYICAVFANDQSANEIKAGGFHHAALIKAAQHDACLAAKALLKNGACANSCRQESRQTALMVAALANAVDVVDLLIRRGAALEATDAEGNTALTYAAGDKDPTATAQLIKAGASVNHVNHTQETPLLQAISSDALDTFTVLLHAGAGLVIPEKIGDIQHNQISTARAVILESAKIENAKKITKYLQNLGPEES